MSCFKILGRKERLQPHFNCVHDDRPAFENERLQPHFNCVHDDRPAFENESLQPHFNCVHNDRPAFEKESLQPHFNCVHDDRPAFENESLQPHFNCVHDGRPAFEKERLQPHFNCVHDGRPAFEKGQTKLKLGFSTTKRKVSEDEDLSSPTEDQIQCDSCDNETPSASVESPHSFLPAFSLFRPSSSTLPSLESNENLIGQMKVLLEKLEINVCRNRTNNSSPKSQSHFLHLFGRKARTLQPQSQQTR